MSEHCVGRADRLVGADPKDVTFGLERDQRRLDIGVWHGQVYGIVIARDKCLVQPVLFAVGNIAGQAHLLDEDGRPVADEIARLVQRDRGDALFGQQRIRDTVDIRRAVDQRAIKVEYDTGHGYAAFHLIEHPIEGI